MAATFGTKPEEDLSYENSHKLMITTTVCMISFLVLEIAFYFLYNRKVRVRGPTNKMNFKKVKLQ